MLAAEELVIKAKILQSLKHVAFSHYFGSGYDD